MNKKEIVLFLMVICLMQVLFSNFAIILIDGNSMAPTFTDSDYVLIKKHKTPKVGDIVVFSPQLSWLDNEARNNKEAKDRKFVKRVVATNQNEVNFRGQEILVDGNNVVEIECFWGIIDFEGLSEHEILVAGDNSERSNDSLYNYCIGNQDFKVNQKDVLFFGEEKYIFKRGD